MIDSHQLSIASRLDDTVDSLVICAAPTGKILTSCRLLDPIGRFAPLLVDTNLAAESAVFESRLMPVLWSTEMVLSSAKVHAFLQ